MANSTALSVASSTALVSMADATKADISGLFVLLQCTIALIVFNVWTLRAAMKTPFRGLDRPSLSSEFEAYGFPKWVYQVVGPVKLSFATLMIVGLVYPVALSVGAAGIMMLMVGALLCHIKVNDAALKSAPSFTFGMLCLGILVAQHSGVVVVADETSSQFPAVLAP